MYFILFYQYQIQIHDKLQRPLQGSRDKGAGRFRGCAHKTPENLNPFSCEHERSVC